MSDPNNDFVEEEKTPTIPNETMEKLMETVRSSGVPDGELDDMTKRMRPPMVYSRTRTR